MQPFRQLPDASTHAHTSSVLAVAEHAALLAAAANAPLHDNPLCACLLAMCRRVLHSRCRRILQIHTARGRLLLLFKKDKQLTVLMCQSWQCLALAETRHQPQQLLVPVATALFCRMQPRTHLYIQPDCCTSCAPGDDNNSTNARTCVTSIAVYLCCLVQGKSSGLGVFA